MKTQKAWAIFYKGKIQDIYLHKDLLNKYLKSAKGLLAFNLSKDYEVKEIEIRYK